MLPGLILVGAGIGSAIVSAVAIGQQGVDPRDAGTAGAVNNVAQQIGSALGIAVISTFVATATNHYLADHGSTAVVAATVHGFTVGFWWAAGAFWAGAVICACPDPQRHPVPPGGRPARAPRRDRQRTDLNADPARPTNPDTNEGAHIMTTISIIGSGNMASAIGTRAVKHGHTVELMSRNPAKAQALADQIGNGATVGTYGAGRRVTSSSSPSCTPARSTWSRRTAMRWPARSSSTSPTRSTPTPAGS